MMGGWRISLSRCRQDAPQRHELQVEPDTATITSAKPRRRSYALILGGLLTHELASRRDGGPSPPRPHFSGGHSA